MPVELHFRSGCRGELVGRTVVGRCHLPSWNGQVQLRYGQRPRIDYYLAAGLWRERQFA
jgi:hypothetical protein